MQLRRREFTAALLAGGALPALGSMTQAGQVADEATALEPVCPSGRLRFQVLGSAAGIPIPRFSCTCPACVQARTKGGKHIRTFTSMNFYLPGDVLGRAKYRVDLSPDTTHHIYLHKLDETALEHVLFTHDHSDHCCPEILSFRSKALSGPDSLRTLHLYGGEAVETLLRAQAHLETGKMEFHRINPFEKHVLDERLTVHSLRSFHGNPSYLNYVVQAEGLTVLLAWDTGYWQEETWEAAKQFRFDAVFLECTVAADTSSNLSGHHLKEPTFRLMKERMTELGMLQPEAPFVAVHIGDNGRRDHDELVELWRPHGVTISYDGLVVEVGRA